MSTHVCLSLQAGRQALEDAFAAYCREKKISLPPDRPASPPRRRAHCSTAPRRQNPPHASSAPTAVACNLEPLPLMPASLPPPAPPFISSVPQAPSSPSASPLVTPTAPTFPVPSPFISQHALLPLPAISPPPPSKLPPRSLPLRPSSSRRQASLQTRVMEEARQPSPAEVWRSTPIVLSTCSPTLLPRQLRLPLSSPLRCRPPRRRPPPQPPPRPACFTIFGAHLLHPHTPPALVCTSYLVPIGDSAEDAPPTPTANLPCLSNPAISDLPPSLLVRPPSSHTPRCRHIFTTPSLIRPICHVSVPPPTKICFSPHDNVLALSALHSPYPSHSPHCRSFSHLPPLLASIPADPYDPNPTHPPSPPLPAISPCPPLLIGKISGTPPSTSSPLYAPAPTADKETEHPPLMEAVTHIKWSPAAKQTPSASTKTPPPNEPVQTYYGSTPTALRMPDAALNTRVLPPDEAAFVDAAAVHHITATHRKRRSYPSPGITMTALPLLISLLLLTNDSDKSLRLQTHTATTLPYLHPPRFIPLAPHPPNLPPLCRPPPQPPDMIIPAYGQTFTMSVLALHQRFCFQPSPPLADEDDPPSAQPTPITLDRLAISLLDVPVGARRKAAPNQRHPRPSSTTERNIPKGSTDGLSPYEPLLSQPMAQPPGSWLQPNGSAYDIGIVPTLATSPRPRIHGVLPDATRCELQLDEHDIFRYLAHGLSASAIPQVLSTVFSFSECCSMYGLPYIFRAIIMYLTAPDRVPMNFCFYLTICN